MTSGVPDTNGETMSDEPSMYFEMTPARRAVIERAAAMARSKRAPAIPMDMTEACAGVVARIADEGLPDRRSVTFRSTLFRETERVLVAAGVPALLAERDALRDAVVSLYAWLTAAHGNAQPVSHYIVAQEAQVAAENAFTAIADAEADFVWVGHYDWGRASGFLEGDT